MNDMVYFTDVTFNSCKMVIELILNQIGNKLRK